MNAIVMEVISRAAHWPEEDQEELAQVALEIELRRKGSCTANADELAAIDAALAAIGRGEIAADAEAEAVLARFRQT